MRRKRKILFSQFGAINCVEDFDIGTTLLESSVYVGRVKRGRYHPADHMWSLSKTLGESGLVSSTTELHAQAQGALPCSSIRETACHHSPSLGHNVFSAVPCVCMCVDVFMRFNCCVSICFLVRIVCIYDFI